MSLTVLRFPSSQGLVVVVPELQSSASPTQVTHTVPSAKTASMSFIVQGLRSSQACMVGVPVLQSAGSPVHGTQTESSQSRTVSISLTVLRFPSSQGLVVVEPVLQSRGTPWQGTQTVPSESELPMSFSVQRLLSSQLVMVGNSKLIMAVSFIHGWTLLTI